MGPLCELVNENGGILKVSQLSELLRKSLSALTFSEHNLRYITNTNTANPIIL